MAKQALITEKVLSPIEDKNIKNDLQNSPIWKKAYHSTDTLPEEGPMWLYQIKFNGVKPVQVSKIERVK